MMDFNFIETEAALASIGVIGGFLVWLLATIFVRKKLFFSVLEKKEREMKESISEFKREVNDKIESLQKTVGEITPTLRRVNETLTEVKTAMEKASETMAGIDRRVTVVETVQKMEHNKNE